MGKFRATVEYGLKAWKSYSVNRHYNAAMTYANRALSAYQGQSRLPLWGDKFVQ